MRTGDEFLERCGRAARTTPCAWALVHRTHGAKIGSIGRGDALEPKRAGSAAEHAAGRPLAVYLFVGAGIYPYGDVALLVRRGLLDRVSATFTPYDTGGVHRGRMTHPGTEDELYDAWCTDAGDLAAVFPHYVAACFEDHADYVRRTTGTPDRTPPHGVTANDGRFAGAWVVEVQVQQPVPVDEWLERVLVARRDLLAELPDAWFGRARHAFDDAPLADTDEAAFADAIARVILEL